MKGLPTTFIIQHSVDNAQVWPLDQQVQVFTRLMRERVQAKVIAHTFASGFAISELGPRFLMSGDGTCRVVSISKMHRLLGLHSSDMVQAMINSLPGIFSSLDETLQNFKWLNTF